MIKKELRFFRYLNKCDTGNTCFVYVWTPVPITCPLFISLAVINLYILCGFRGLSA